MRILYVTSKGGIHDYRFLSKLSENHKVLLLHYAASELIPEISSIPGLEIISCTPLIKSFPLISHFVHFKNVVRSFCPDLIHTGYVWQVGILPAIWNCHPHLSMPWGSDILIEPDKSRFKRWLVKKVMRQCDHIQCDAFEVKRKIVSDYEVPEDKITVFPWGIDLSTFKVSEKSECRTKLGLNNNKFIIVHNRHLNYVYGTSYLLDGFRLFSENKNDVLLLILSDGPLRKDVDVFIDKYNLHDKIAVIGKVPNQTMPDYLNASDVYISVSLSDGTSLSLLEAMACGSGVVVSDVPAIREWVGNENGIVVSKRNSADICRALQFYYDNREQLIIHGKKNITIAKERADWNKNYCRLESVYNYIAGK